MAATGFPGYSHRSQYISELGAQGAPDGALVSAGFVVIGVLLLAGTAGTVRALASAVPIAFVLAVGLVGGGLGGSYAVTGVARCDAGCPDVGDVSTAQQVHNLVGSLGYGLAIGGVALFGVATRRTAGPGARTFARISLIGVPVLVVVAGLVTALDDWRGVLQRVLEVLLFAWLLAVAAFVAGPRSAPCCCPTPSPPPSTS